MKTLRTLAALLFTASLLVQCSEEELVSNPEVKITDVLKDKTISSLTTNSVFKIGATANQDYDDMYPGYDYEFYMGSSGASISVNWGDGTITTHFIDTPYNSALRHSYSNPGNYVIKITGDLDKITHFDSYYGMGEFYQIDFRVLPNLQQLNVGLTASSSIINLNHNPKLERVSLAGMEDLKALVLPKSHSIRNINLDGPFGMDTHDVDGIIQNIYKNAVSKNLTGGIFTLPASWAQDENDYSMIGPPSASSIDKLRALQNVYGWSIYPALDPAAPNM